MDLLDRYLAAVAALLPKAQREDIVAELRDLLLDQMEAKAEQLGRPLDAKETEAVLKAFGHPIAVAGRFGTPRSLIGPELYPFYIFGVKGLLAVAAFATALPLIIGLITGDLHAADVLARFLSSFITLALTLIGAATVVAAGIELGWLPGRKLDWKVSDLPRLDGGKKGLVKKPGGSRFEAAFELAATVLFILWWTGLVAAPWSNRVAGSDMVLEPTAVWTTLHWPILAWAGVQVASSLVAILRPSQVRVRAALELVCSLAGLGVTATLWSAGRLVTVAGHGAADPGVAGLQNALDLSFHITLIVMTVVFTCKTLGDLWRLYRGAERPDLAAG